MTNFNATAPREAIEEEAASGVLQVRMNKIIPWIPPETELGYLLEKLPHEIDSPETKITLSEITTRLLDITSVAQKDLIPIGEYLFHIQEQLFLQGLLTTQILMQMRALLLVESNLLLSAIESRNGNRLLAVTQKYLPASILCLEPIVQNFVEVQQTRDASSLQEEINRLHIPHAPVFNGCELVVMTPDILSTVKAEDCGFLLRAVGKKYNELFSAPPWNIDYGGKSGATKYFLDEVFPDKSGEKPDERCVALIVVKGQVIGGLLIAAGTKDAVISELVDTIRLNYSSNSELVQREIQHQLESITNALLSYPADSAILEQFMDKNAFMRMVEEYDIEDIIQQLTDFIQAETNPDGLEEMRPIIVSFLNAIKNDLDDITALRKLIYRLCFNLMSAIAMAKTSGTYSIQWTISAQEGGPNKSNMESIFRFLTDLKKDHIIRVLLGVADKVPNLRIRRLVNFIKTSQIIWEGNIVGSQSAQYLAKSSPASTQIVVAGLDTQALAKDILGDFAVYRVLVQRKLHLISSLFQKEG